MKLSRFFGLTAVLVATTVSCGGSSSGDDQTQADAKVKHDATEPSGIDAGSSAGSASDFGKSCTGGGSGDSSLCDAADAECVTLTGTAFYCTDSCGSGPCVAGGTAGSANCFMVGSNQAQPPSGGDAICKAQALSNGTGTPACVIAGTGSGSGSAALDWSCGIECGSAGSTNLGTCPTGLTCTGNICQ